MTVKFVVTNAFSINMMTESDDVVFEKVSVNHAAQLLQTEKWESAIGHSDTAAVVSGLLGTHVPENRKNVTLERGTALLVAQYTGPRLPEGATSLPEGAKIQFWQVFHTTPQPWNFGQEPISPERIAEIQLL